MECKTVRKCPKCGAEIKNPTSYRCPRCMTELPALEGCSGNCIKCGVLGKKEK